MNAPEILYIFLDNREKEFERLTIDRSKLRPETIELTDDMLVILTRLFYEKVFKSSPSWQKEGKDCEERIRAYIAGKETAITLPPGGDLFVSNVYLHTGDGVLRSHFKAEGELIEKFTVEASKIVYNEFAMRLNFNVIALDADFVRKLGQADGLVFTFNPICGFYIWMELI
jgi:hypothetical protein